MGTAGVTAEALGLRRLQESDAGLRLLRMELAPFAVAVLNEHLGGQIRRLPAVELHELIEADLVSLREAGFDLPQTARSYCDEWRRAGILVRTSQPGSREELYELSAAAEAALRYVTHLEAPRAAVTQSRLVTISSALQALARDTDPSVRSRLEALHAERERIDKEIARVRAGDFETLDPDLAAERLREILALAEEVPGDFARVRADLATLNRSLREQVAAPDASRGQVLDDVFRGVDRMNSSEAGRSFLAFHELLTDPESSANLDDSLSQVLERSVGQEMSRADRRFLLGWRSLLMDESVSVRATMTGFSRALAAFVRSRLFEEHRRLTVDIRQAQLLASRVAQETNPAVTTIPGLELRLTGLTPASITGWRLHNPEDVEVKDEVTVHEAEPLDIEALRAVMRETEIDMGELVDAVNARLAAHGTSTIGEVLTDSPATQGLASVLGLIVLALRHGEEEDAQETITWTTRGGATRRSLLPTFRFTHPLPSHGASHA